MKLRIKTYPAKENAMENLMTNKSALLNWFENKKIQKLSISYSILCKKHSNLLACLERKNSHIWMDRWLSQWKEHKIIYRKLHSEQDVVNEAAKNWQKEVWAKLIQFLTLRRLGCFT